MSSVTSGLEQLRQELERLSEALRAFDAPVVDELPGLRLMGHVLEERRSQVAGKLRGLERCQLVIGVSGEGLPDDGLPAELVAGLLDALQQAAQALGAQLVSEWSPAPDDAVVRAETALRLVAWDAGPPALLTLHFPRRPEEQLIDAATRTPLLERVLDTLAAGLEGGSHATALAPVARLMVASAVALHLTTVVSGGESREVLIDRVAAQRLLAQESAA